jgi:nucleotide-binding universal stress UspA family protein
MAYSTILVPIAPGYGDEAHRALEVARSLLTPEGKITVVSVIEELPAYLTVDIYYAMDPTVQENQMAVREAIVAEFTAPDVEVETCSGHPTRAILDVAKKGEHECIVIASSQPGWEHFFLGSTASGVVRHARCSVHVVRRRPSEDVKDS